MHRQTPTERTVGNLWASIDNWQAWEQAEEEFASTPHEVADWLLDAVAEHVGPDDVIDTLRINEHDIQGQPPHVLLALIMTGTDKQAGLARMFLRDAFKEARLYAIGKRATEIEADRPADYWDSDVGCEFDD